MSNDNRPQDEERDDQDNNDQSSQQGQNRRGGALLEYSLTPMKDAAAFVIYNQSDYVTSFLKKVGTYQAMNGIRIALGVRFPEWKESKNIIFLDGTNGRMYNRQDVTRFPTNGRTIRDNKIGMFHSAILEFVGSVKRAYGLSLEETIKPKAERIVLR